MNVALFVRKDSAYKKRDTWQVYDFDRNAKTYNLNLPIVAHPPCRAWGQLSHMSNPREGEKELTPWVVKKIQKLGGILEHPKGSRIFKTLPEANTNITDSYGGFVILIDQYDFGHVCHKDTKLYIVGIDKKDLPQLPKKDNTLHRCAKGKLRSICGDVKINGERTTRATQYMREYTPEKLIDWFEKVLFKIRKNKNA
ncbi:MAG: hypothetical protein Tp118DCM00d2C30442581_31 [Prokaryotic dsDNA virus sp.]|nr:MAG: hypothetical protein Tp118DCM00d2C30442581_31 [Prokaryotic dsDNA virus sp.]|tara:strand:- start:20971 stop:21561 length:591 start_codon:yes stop_codon:yes gene_type:complete